MTGKRKTDKVAGNPAPVITRKKVRDGVIVSEEIEADLTVGTAADQFAAMQEMLPTVAVQIGAYARKAQGVIDAGATDTRLEYAQDALWQARELTRYLRKGDADGAVQHALWMMQCIWRMDVKGVEPTIVTGIKSKKQRTDAGFSSGEERTAERQPEWDRWQAAADTARAENPGLKDSRIHEIVAAQFGRTRQAIANRVTLVAKERPHCKK